MPRGTGGTTRASEPTTNDTTKLKPQTKVRTDTYGHAVHVLGHRPPRFVLRSSPLRPLDEPSDSVFRLEGWPGPRQKPDDDVSNASLLPPALGAVPPHLGRLRQCPRVATSLPCVSVSHRQTTDEAATRHKATHAAPDDEPRLPFVGAGGEAIVDGNSKASSTCRSFLHTFRLGSSRP